MNDNKICGYEGLRVEAKALIENEQTPFLCMHFDKTLEKVFILADSESLQKLREVKALVEIENILKNTFEECKKLTLFDQKLEVGRPSCQKAGGLSHHTCHACKPQYHLSWEKNLQGCFEDSALTDVDYEKLPKEILRGIFEYLKPSDLQSVVLVSKHWKSVADEPALWKEFGLPFKCKKNENQFLEFFQKSISSKLQKLELDNFSFQLNDDHFENLLRLDLNCITIKNIDLFNISDEYLAEVVNKSKSCEILEHKAELKTTSGNNINVLGLNKLKAIFRKMESGTRLKSLEIDCIAGFDKTLDLSLIPSITLANAFNNLESLELRQVKLRPNQLRTIFDNTSVYSKLKYIKLEKLNMESVDMQIFDFLFSNLTQLYLSELQLDKTQLKQFAENLDKSCKLKALVLSYMNVEEIPPELLARVVTKVSFVNLQSVDITVDQLDKIFHCISTTGSSAIEELILDADIDQINPETLAIAINKLKFFDFEALEFTEDQTKAMFKVMSQGTNLKMLGTARYETPLEEMDNIKKVDPEILAEAIHNLEEVKLGFEDSFLSLPQLVAIFKRLGHKTKLKKVCSLEEEIFL